MGKKATESESVLEKSLSAKTPRKRNPIKKESEDSYEGQRDKGSLYLNYIK